MPRPEIPILTPEQVMLVCLKSMSHQSNREDGLTMVRGIVTGFAPTNSFEEALQKLATDAEETNQVGSLFTEILEAAYQNIYPQNPHSRLLGQQGVRAFRLRYGIVDGRIWSLKSIAQELKVNRGKPSVILDRAKRGITYFPSYQKIHEIIINLREL